MHSMMSSGEYILTTSLAHQRCESHSGTTSSQLMTDCLIGTERAIDSGPSIEHTNQQAMTTSLCAWLVCRHDAALPISLPIPVGFLTA